MGANISPVISIHCYIRSAQVGNIFINISIIDCGSSIATDFVDNNGGIHSNACGTTYSYTASNRNIPQQMLCLSIDNKALFGICQSSGFFF